jgi:uncharacterized protein YggE
MTHDTRYHDSEFPDVARLRELRDENDALQTKLKDLIEAAEAVVQAEGFEHMDVCDLRAAIERARPRPIATKRATKPPKFIASDAAPAIANPPSVDR